jgi:hypothetical protein
MVSIFKDEEDYIIRFTKKVEDYFIKYKYHYEEQFHFQGYLISFNYQKNRIHLTVELPMIKENKDKEKGLIVMQEINLLKKVDKNLENLVRFMIEEKKKLFQDKSYLSSLIQDVFINRWVFIQECPICVEFNAHTRCDRCQFPICALCLNKFMTFENSERIAKKFCQCNRNFLVFNKMPCHRLIIHEANRNFSVFNIRPYHWTLEDKPPNDLFYNRFNNEDINYEETQAENTQAENNGADHSEADDTEDEDTEDQDSEDENTEDEDTETEDTDDNVNDNSEDEDTDDDVNDNSEAEDTETEEDKLAVSLFLKAVQNFSPDFIVNANCLRSDSDDDENNVEDLEN